jgi:glycerol-3-phosphate dehydrogenase
MMQEFNTVIIGGGIVGAGLFRDLCLHEVPTLLIDKDDFTSKTSQSSSKMLHGGIRYLENMDFQLVFEALHEKNLWLKIAPHLCYEENFYMPVFEDAQRPLWMIKCGLMLYDFLSGYKNSPHRIVNRKKTNDDLNLLRKNGLSGSGVYYDAIVDDSKMTLELIYDALLYKKSKALNYHELLADELQKDKVCEYHLLTIKNHLTDEIIKIKTQNIIYATGPYTDECLKKMIGLTWEPILLPSKGSHLWFSKNEFPLEHPVVMTTNEGRVIFVIPQNDLVLVGTTEIAPDSKIDQIKISNAEIDYLINNLNNYFPEAKLKAHKIIGAFSGIRPLVKESSGSDLGKTSREHKIVMPRSNTYVIAGGKYTTFRVMGQEITRNILSHKNKNYNPDYSMTTLRIPSIIPAFHFHVPSSHELECILKNEFPKSLEDLVHRRIGVQSKKIWNLKSSIEFDEYFFSQLEIINKYFPLTREEILNYREI